ncbi:MAG: hypothetical protein ABII23_05355, partial [bacterium]
MRNLKFNNIYIFGICFCLFCSSIDLFALHNSFLTPPSIQILDAFSAKQPVAKFMTLQEAQNALLETGFYKKPFDNIIFQAYSLAE